MTPPATSHDSTLNLSCIEYTTTTPLQNIILDVVDSIISQDSTSRGAWDYVVMRRVSLDSAYSPYEVEREMGRMLEAGRLYENCYEILDGVFPIVYVRNANELNGGDNEYGEHI